MCGHQWPLFSCSPHPTSAFAMESPCIRIRILFFLMPGGLKIFVGCLAYNHGLGERLIQ
jgi:hypothetical protein